MSSSKISFETKCFIYDTILNRYIRRPSQFGYRLWQIHPGAPVHPGWVAGPEGSGTVQHHLHATSTDLRHRRGREGGSRARGGCGQRAGGLPDPAGEQDLSEHQTDLLHHRNPFEEVGVWSGPRRCDPRRGRRGPREDTGQRLPSHVSTIFFPFIRVASHSSCSSIVNPLTNSHNKRPIIL